MVDQKLKEAARNFVNPNDKNNYRFQNSEYYISQYGKTNWEEACIKARTEYNFGTNAVKW